MMTWQAYRTTVAQKWQSEQKGKIASRVFKSRGIGLQFLGDFGTLSQHYAEKCWVYSVFGFFKWRQFFRWSGEPRKYDKEELCTLELHHFGMLENGVYKGGKKIGIDLGYKVDITQRVTSLKVYYKGPAKSSQHVVNEVLVLYYHDPTHNNELESEDKGQQQHSEDVGNEDEYEEEEEEDEEKEDVIVDSDYELSEEEENGNNEAASKAQPRNNAPNVEYAQCFEEMNEMPLNEATWEISDNDEDSDRLPYDGDSSGDEEDGQKKASKRKWKKKNFKQFRKETDLRNP
ncbi:unnamed protein product [Prunus armeniaca]|uniref:Uncharacterized protein n=1 Tax=Prunus armeniaca TaxID=36596 RepID=A0A6J5W462_PRUAR|nr:unnamed protein product [Prunus armeniaca]